MKRWETMLYAGAVAVFLLSGCGGVTDEMLADREAAVQMLENGDYEEAVAALNQLVANAEAVTDFELDVLKYRAEAEYQLGDYQAAAYTYDILNQVDKERAEYYYFGAAALAKAKDVSSAEELLEKGAAMEEQPDDERVSGMADYARAVICNQKVLERMEKEEYEEALKLAEEGIRLAGSEASQELKFNRAVCYEYLGQWKEALSQFESYVSEYGSDEKAEHEIAFLKTR